MGTWIISITALIIKNKHLFLNSSKIIQVFADPFFSKEFLNELKQDIENVKSGKSVLEQYDIVK